MARQIPAWLVVSLSVALTGCGLPTLSPSSQSGSSVAPATSPTASSPATAKSIKIVATVLPMYWFTKAVVGDTAEVSLLVPPTAEVHEYQATPDNVRAIAEAHVVIKNGLGLEEFLDATIANAGNSKLTVIDATKGMVALGAISPMVAVGEERGGDEHGHAEGETHDQANETEAGTAAEQDHTHAAGNPHVWIDPVIAQQQVAAIRDGLIAAAPENRTIYEANAAAYIQQLQDLHAKYVDALKPYQGCAFITFHDAYPYLAQRYQLKQVAVVSIPEDSLSPAEIKQTIDAVRQYKVKALFGEPGVDNKLLQSLAKDLNLSLRPIDPLERGQMDVNYYFQVMQQNLQTLIAACQANRN